MGEAKILDETLDKIAYLESIFLNIVVVAILPSPSPWKQCCCLQKKAWSLSVCRKQLWTGGRVLLAKPLIWKKCFVVHDSAHWHRWPLLWKILVTLLNGCVLLGPVSLSLHPTTLSNILDKVTHIPILSYTKQLNWTYKFSRFFHPVYTLWTASIFKSVTVVLGLHADVLYWKYKTSAHRMINGLNHWSKKINVANCHLHLRPKRKKKKDASSQWLVTAVLMSKDRHYIYPEGRCTEPKFRETIRLISNNNNNNNKKKNSVCSERGKAERDLEFKEQIQRILRGIFQRYNPCALFQINPKSSPNCFHASDLITFLIFQLPTKAGNLNPKLFDPHQHLNPEHPSLPGTHQIQM